MVVLQICWRPVILTWRMRLQLPKWSWGQASTRARPMISKAASQWFNSVHTLVSNWFIRRQGSCNFIWVPWSGIEASNAVFSFLELSFQSNTAIQQYTSKHIKTHQSIIISYQTWPKKDWNENEHVKNLAETLPLSITQHLCNQMQQNLRRNKTATNFTPSSSNLATVDFKVAFSAAYFAQFTPSGSNLATVDFKLAFSAAYFTQSKFKLAFSFETDCFSAWTSFSWASFSTIWACKDFTVGRGPPLRIRRLRPVFTFHCTKQWQSMLYLWPLNWTWNSSFLGEWLQPS